MLLVLMALASLALVTPAVAQWNGSRTDYTGTLTRQFGTTYTNTDGTTRMIDISALSDSVNASDYSEVQVRVGCPLGSPQQTLYDLPFKSEAVGSVPAGMPVLFFVGTGCEYRVDAPSHVYPFRWGEAVVGW